MNEILIPTFLPACYNKPLNLDITNKCPLQCPSCLRQSPAYITARRNYNEMSIDEFKKIVDDLLKKESWRGGWEGKEEYMKYKKDFQIGAYRLGNLFNKHKLFLKLLTESNILKVTYGILKDDMKIGALDMREPKKSKGSQDLHIDWIPKKNSNDPTENIVCFIFLDDSTKENGSIRVVPKTQRKTGWINENLDKSGLI